MGLGSNRMWHHPSAISQTLKAPSFETCFPDPEPRDPPALPLCYVPDP